MQFLADLWGAAIASPSGDVCPVCQNEWFSSNKPATEFIFSYSCLCVLEIHAHVGTSLSKKRWVVAEKAHFLKLPAVLSLEVWAVSFSGYFLVLLAKQNHAQHSLETV